MLGSATVPKPVYLFYPRIEEKLTHSWCLVDEHLQWSPCICWGFSSLHIKYSSGHLACVPLAEEYTRTSRQLAWLCQLAGATAVFPTNTPFPLCWNWIATWFSSTLSSRLRGALLQPVNELLHFLRAEAPSVSHFSSQVFLCLWVSWD